jgi:threonine/homoserine/homoserine lactone efflux protein
MGISLLEFVPLLLFACIWFGGLGLLFWMLWRILRAVERIAENTRPRG